MNGYKRSEILAFRVALFAALCLVTWLMTYEIPAEIGGRVNDKLSHLLTFYGLALLADFAFPEPGLAWRKGLSLFAYGVGIECIQYTLPYREFSIADMVANGLGILAYSGSVPLLRSLPLLRRRWKPANEETRR